MRSRCRRSSRRSTTTPSAIRCGTASRSRTWQCWSRSPRSRPHSRRGSSDGATSLLERRPDLEKMLVELDLEVLHVSLFRQLELVPEPRALDVDRVSAVLDVEVVQVRARDPAGDDERSGHVSSMATASEL